jgi:rhomboid protease GluP
LPLPLRWRWKIERFRESLSSIFHRQEQQRRPRLCPACGTLVGSTATRCHQCGASLTFSMAAMSRSLSKYLPANAPVTYVIFGACCLVYCISLLLTLHSGAPITPQGGGIFDMLFGIGGISTRVLFRLGGSLPLPFNLAQPWRFVTACFLHASIVHIGFNMWVLIDLAPLVEEMYGSARFLFLYTTCGIGGYVLSSASPFIGILRGLHLATNGVGIGASGAIVGLIGVLLALTYRHRGMEQLRRMMYHWIIYLVVWGLFFPGIDNMAHLGGGITGLILGKLMLDRPPQTTGERKRAYALGWATAIVILLSFGIMILNARRPLPF